jgi:hypothetical protein
MGLSFRSKSNLLRLEEGKKKKKKGKKERKKRNLSHILLSSHPLDEESLSIEGKESSRGRVR